MINRLLYHTPGSCSRVAMIALEEIGEPYEDKCIAIMAGEQRSPEYLAVNPKGKIPVLVEQGVAVTELPVILYHLAVASPNARLLPLGAQGAVGLSALSDLVWVAGALHTTVGRCFRPSNFSIKDPEGVKEKALAELSEHAARISRRLATQPWWYGETWSITDSFVAWIVALAARCDFALHQYPALEHHRAAAEQRPAFVHARAREQMIAARYRLVMPPGFAL